MATATGHPLSGIDGEGLSAQEIIELVVRHTGPNVALACSFQKEEAVLVDMLMQVDPTARIFALDTGVLFTETYATWVEMEERYGIRVESFSGMSLAEQAAAHGDRLWERDPAGCCGIRKVEPLKRALAGLDGWITGIRRDQSPTRANAPKIGWDDAFGLWKANPLADWSGEQVMAEIAVRGLPVNPLHAQGYESIGCTHCTKPGTGREGRWSGQEKTECGLHVPAAEQTTAG